MLSLICPSMSGKQIKEMSLPKLIPPQSGHCRRSLCSRGGNKVMSYWACRLCGRRLIEFDRRTDQARYYHCPPCVSAQVEKETPTPPLGAPAKKGSETPPYARIAEFGSTGEQCKTRAKESHVDPGSFRTTVRRQRRKSDEADLQMEPTDQEEWTKVEINELKETVKKLETMLSKQLTEQTKAGEDPASSTPSSAIAASDPPQRSDRDDFLSNGSD